MKYLCFILTLFVFSSFTTHSTLKNITDCGESFDNVSYGCPYHYVKGELHYSSNYNFWYANVYASIKPNSGFQYVFSIGGKNTSATYKLSSPGAAGKIKVQGGKYYKIQQVTGHINMNVSGVQVNLSPQQFSAAHQVPCKL